jgi:hypothetical protein
VLRCSLNWRYPRSIFGSQHGRCSFADDPLQNKTESPHNKVQHHTGQPDRRWVINARTATLAGTLWMPPSASRLPLNGTEEASVTSHKILYNIKRAHCNHYSRHQTKCPPACATATQQPTANTTTTRGRAATRAALQRTSHRPGAVTHQHPVIVTCTPRARVHS